MDCSGSVNTDMITVQFAGLAVSEQIPRERLIEASEVFRAGLAWQGKETHEKKWQISTPVTELSAKAFLEFVNSGKVLFIKDPFSLLDLGLEYQAPALIEECEENIICSREKSEILDYVLCRTVTATVADLTWHLLKSVATLKEEELTKLVSQVQPENRAACEHFFQLGKKFVKFNFERDADGVRRFYVSFEEQSFDELKAFNQLCRITVLHFTPSDTVRLQDISALCSDTLQELVMAWNSPVDFTGCKEFTQLHTVNLTATHATNESIRVLSTLCGKTLKWLILNNCKQITTLQECTLSQIRHLDVYLTKIPEDEIASLRQKYPDATIKDYHERRPYSRWLY